jgi:hypothetical protein
MTVCAHVVSQHVIMYKHSRTETLSQNTEKCMPNYILLINNAELNLYRSNHISLISMYWKLKSAYSTVKRFTDNQAYYCRFAQRALFSVGSSDLRIVVDTDGP